jgi:hypothetical protein
VQYLASKLSQRKEEPPIKELSGIKIAKVSALSNVA